MHHATRRMAAVASTYASQVPLLAKAQTSGMVAAGVVVGAMVETDCASVSIGESTSRRNPYPAICRCTCAGFPMQDRSFFPPNSAANESGYHTGLAGSVQGAIAVEETAVIIQIQTREIAAR